MSSATAPLTAVVLAAGAGTRMRSPRPKVLHGFAGRSLLGHVLAALEPLTAAETIVVVGHEREQVCAHLSQIAPTARAAVQEQQLGTGHAVRTALDHGGAAGVVLVTPGDAPLLTGQTLQRLLAQHTSSGAVATMLTAVVADPTGYGRVLRSGDQVRQVVEEADADQTQRAVQEVAAGVYAFDAAMLRSALERLRSDNAQGELYLPDAVAILVADGHRVGALVADPVEVAGVNSRSQLAKAHALYNARRLERLMDEGVRIIDPASVWIDADVQIEPDATVGPSVQLHGTTRIGTEALIGPDVTLTDTVVGARSRLSRAVAVNAQVGASCEVGPFAYLRPGARLADGVKIGTYVEIKGSDIGEGSKVPHLTYVGDANIGAHTNIGAASVFVNYDGVHKHRSVVGDHARTGADTMFVAPVNIGDGAYTAAGSVITQDVPAGALGVGRARQQNIPGWVARNRAGTSAAEAALRAEEAGGQPGSDSLAESGLTGQDGTSQSPPPAQE